MNDDLLQALALLDSQKHWTLRTLNRSGCARRYEAVVWGNGKRASASALRPLDAARAALRKLYDGRLRIVG